jgi:predicted nucleotidyltransferase component of viral defense system
MLNWQTISPELKEIILTISQNQAFNQFRLCGGTALSLQLGHRISVDADFVSASYFDKNSIIGEIEKTLKDVSDLHTGDFGVFLKSKGIKVDFLSWNIPFIKPVVMKNGISLLDIEEIAAMKLFAITRRGEKKDYIDLAFLLQTYSLKDLVDCYKIRHPKNDTAIVIKFLLSYGDIENQPEPEMIIDFDWQKAKQILKDNIKVYVSS